MAKELLIATLRAIAPIAPEEEDFVRASVSTIHFAKNTYLLRTGEISQSVYFVVRGCARAAINRPDGEEVSCYFAAEGDLIAVYESFLTGTPSQYFMQAMEDCEMLVIDRLGLENMFNRLQNGNLIGRRLTESLLVSTIQRLTDFYRYTPEERFQNFLAQFPHLANRIPQSCLASYIGVKPQSLSRIKKRLQQTENAEMHPS
ncbi:MAG: Crp/Fnr family transcriptional regulator [Bacteroidota bacterium]